MKVNRAIEQVEFQADGGDTITVRYDNRGEPYREGVTLDLHNANTQDGVAVFLVNDEARGLRDLLNRMYPITPGKCPRYSPGGHMKTYAGIIDRKVIGLRIANSFEEARQSPSLQSCEQFVCLFDDRPSGWTIEAAQYELFPNFDSVEDRA